MADMQATPMPNTSNAPAATPLTLFIVLLIIIPSSSTWTIMPAGVSLTRPSVLTPRTLITYVPAFSGCQVKVKVAHWYGSKSAGTSKQLANEELEARCVAPAKKHGLTPKEQEIFLLLAQGARPAAIPENLRISISTTRSHIKRICTKLDIHSQEEVRKVVESVPLAEVVRKH